MGLLQKFKSLFKKKEVKQEEIVSDDTLIGGTNIPQPRGELIGNCILCNIAIGSEDNTKDLKGNKVHKRCFKKAQKAIFNGERPESVFPNGGAK